MEMVAIIIVKILSSPPIILVVGFPLDHTVRLWPKILQMKVEMRSTLKLLTRAAETAVLIIILNKQVITEFNSSKSDEPAKTV
jgi:hypothetical protein